MLNRPIIFVLSLVVMATLSGCSTHVGIRRAATAASEQIGEIQVDLQKKVDAENEYSQEAMDELLRAIQRDWNDGIDAQLQNGARKTVASCQGKADQPLVDCLAQVMKAAVTSWRKADAEREKQLQQTRAKLEKSTHTIEVDQARIGALKNKLRTLGSSRRKKELLAFIREFARDAGSAYGELKKAEP